MTKLITPVQKERNGVRDEIQASTEPLEKWFAKQIRDRNVLYLNKKKSLKWLRAHANEFRASSEAIDALCMFIVSKDIQKVKTEEDFVQMKHTSD